MVRRLKTRQCEVVVGILLDGILRKLELNDVKSISWGGNIRELDRF